MQLNAITKKITENINKNIDQGDGNQFIRKDILSSGVCFPVSKAERIYRDDDLKTHERP